MREHDKVGVVTMVSGTHLLVQGKTMAEDSPGLVLYCSMGASLMIVYQLLKVQYL